jgi:hypothetical protein
MDVTIEIRQSAALLEPSRVFYSRQKFIFEDGHDRLQSPFTITSASQIQSRSAVGSWSKNTLIHDLKIARVQTRSSLSVSEWAQDPAPVTHKHQPAPVQPIRDPNEKMLVLSASLLQVHIVLVNFRVLSASLLQARIETILNSWINSKRVGSLKGLDSVSQNNGALI